MWSEMFNSPVKWLAVLLLRRFSATCLGLMLMFVLLPPRNSWRSSRVSGRLVTRKTALPNLRSVFRTDLMGEKSAGLSQE